MQCCVYIRVLPQANMLRIFSSSYAQHSVLCSCILTEVLACPIKVNSSSRADGPTPDVAHGRSAAKERVSIIRQSKFWMWFLEIQSVQLGLEWLKNITNSMDQCAVLWTIGFNKVRIDEVNHSLDSSNFLTDGFWGLEFLLMHNEWLSCLWKVEALYTSV